MEITKYNIEITDTYWRALDDLEQYWVDERNFTFDQTQYEKAKILNLSDAIKKNPLLVADVAYLYDYPTNLRRGVGYNYHIYYTIQGETVFLLYVSYKKSYPRL